MWFTLMVALAGSALVFGAGLERADGTKWRVVAGALEAEVTPAGLDVLRFKDRWVLGDSHSDPRPAVFGAILTTGWKSIAGTRDSASQAPVIRQDGTTVMFSLRGITSERGGQGK